MAWRPGWRCSNPTFYTKKLPFGLHRDLLRARRHKKAEAVKLGRAERRGLPASGWLRPKQTGSPPIHPTPLTLLYRPPLHRGLRPTPPLRPSPPSLPSSPSFPSSSFPDHLALPNPSLQPCSTAISTHSTQSTMAAIASTSAVASSCLLRNPLAAPHGLRASARPIVGLPALRMSKIVCSAEKKQEQSTDVTGLPQLAAAVTSAATLAYAHPVLALVDERLSTEGTGLGLGLSNSKLTWILVGVTALIWALYFTYASKLPDSGDDSGLDL